jgi:hypothetical protein
VDGARSHRPAAQRDGDEWTVLRAGAPHRDDDAAPVAEARTQLSTVIANFAETAFTTTAQAEQDAERIRRQADEYAEAKRAEAERVLEEARRHLAEMIGNALHGRDVEGAGGHAS